MDRESGDSNRLLPQNWGVHELFGESIRPCVELIARESTGKEFIQVFVSSDKDTRIAETFLKEVSLFKQTFPADCVVRGECELVYSSATPGSDVLLFRYRFNADMLAAEAADDGFVTRAVPKHELDFDDDVIQNAFPAEFSIVLICGTHKPVERGDNKLMLEMKKVPLSGMPAPLRCTVANVMYNRANV